jgi:isopenicillin N synthase-like dioxygenase
MLQESTSTVSQLDALWKVGGNQEPTLNSNIPIVDISKYKNTETRKEFLESLEKALNFGFFAFVDPNLDVDNIERGYAAFREFFSSTDEQKFAIHDPEARGQAGYIRFEQALGNLVPDSKEYLHIGRETATFPNIWPKHMDLEGPAMSLYNQLKRISKPLLEGIAEVLGQRYDFFTEMTENGENLMRALHYFPNPKDGVWAAEHTDIDLITLLPYASEEGLEIEINGKWEQVVVPKNALVVNVGDQLEAFSNGFPSCKHRVRSTKPDTERYSVVFFCHPTDNTTIKPVPGRGEPKYPEGSRLDYLFLRLFSNGQLTEEHGKEVIKGNFIQKIEEMVKVKTAAKSVELWHAGFQKSVDNTLEKRIARLNG